MAKGESSHGLPSSSKTKMEEKAPKHSLLKSMFSSQSVMPGSAMFRDASSPAKSEKKTKSEKPKSEKVKSEKAKSEKVKSEKVKSEKVKSEKPKSEKPKSEKKKPASSRTQKSKSKLDEEFPDEPNFDDFKTMHFKEPTEKPKSKKSVSSKAPSFMASSSKSKQIPKIQSVYVNEHDIKMATRQTQIHDCEYNPFVRHFNSVRNDVSRIKYMGNVLTPPK